MYERSLENRPDQDTQPGRGRGGANRFEAQGQAVGQQSNESHHLPAGHVLRSEGLGNRRAEAAGR